MDISEATRVGFTGHQGLTRRTEELIRTEITHVLKNWVGVGGVCSLAEGSDQIFGECVLKGGGRLTVVIPSRRYETTFTNPRSLGGFNELLAQASKVIELEYDKPSEAAFWAAGQRVVDESDQLIAVWDGKPAVGLGGTGDVVRYAEESGKEVLIIWPEDARRR